MLNSIRSDQTGKCGLIDYNEDGSYTPLTPLKYERIIFQKYGIAAYDAIEKRFDAYLYTGQLLCKKVLNPLFLADDLLLVSNDTMKCYIIDYSKEKPTVSTSFDTILFFMGSNQQAMAYSAKANFFNFFNSPDYLANGAHMEDLVGARIDNAWGVINRKTNQIYAEFKNSIMVQCIGGNIAAKGFDGIVRQQL